MSNVLSVKCLSSEASGIPCNRPRSAYGRLRGVGIKPVQIEMGCRQHMEEMPVTSILC